MKRFEGKVAVVTGGSSGIGLATARRLHREGARVAICGRDEQKLRRAGASIGPDVVDVRADVANLDDIDRFLGIVGDKLGRMDILFVNAGLGRFVPLASAPESVYDEVFAVNTKSAYFTIQKAIPHLNGGASIILNALAPVTPAWRTM